MKDEEGDEKKKATEKKKGSNDRVRALRGTEEADDDDDEDERLRVSARVREIRGRQTDRQTD